MKLDRSPLLPLVSALAVIFSLTALRPLIAGPVLTWEPFVVFGVPGLIGAVLALLRVGRLLSGLISLAVGLGLLAWHGLSVNPGSDPITSFVTSTQAGIKVLAESTLPASPDPYLMWLILLLTGLSWLLTTWFADILEQPAWTIAPLALPFGISALVAPDELTVPMFLPAAIGFAAILLACGRPGAAPGRPGFEGSRWLIGALAAGLAIVLAVAVAAILPMGPKQPWRSDGLDKPIQLGDPTLDLSENLHRPEPLAVLTYTASDNAPHYLRTTAMTKLTSDGAQLDSMKLRTGDIGGAYDAPGDPVELNVSMRFPSQYLPAAFSPDRIHADGKWAWDPGTLSIVSTSSNGAGQTANLDYKVTSVVPTADPQAIAKAAAGTSPDGERDLHVPSDVPAEVWDLAKQVTAGAETAGAKAQKLVEFFQGDDFEYSLDAPSASGSSALAAFLLKDRSGYCIHYSVSMALLARMEGIPARVAVGFTGGASRGGSFYVTTDDAHAWPELYLDGLGWVPFEPTKSIASRGNQPSPSPQPEPSPSPSPSAAESPSAQPSTIPSPQPSAAPGSQADGGNAGLPVAVLGWLVLALALLAAPALVRLVLRALRLRTVPSSTAFAASVWQEVAATFADLKLPWDGRSPVRAAEALAAELPAEAVGGLSAIAATIERCQYARKAPDTSQLAAQTRQLLKLLPSGVSRGAAVWAKLWPRSLFTRFSKSK